MIILLIDMLRGDHLGCHGYVRNTSPYIDEMARRGIKFNNAFAQNSWTLPSVGTIFTGRYPTSHGAMTSADQVPLIWTMMAEAFQIKGYSTAAFVTNPYLKSIYNMEQGFEVYDDAPLKRTFFQLAIENTPYLWIIPDIIYKSKSLLGLPTPDLEKMEVFRWWSKKLSAENVNKRAAKWIRKNQAAPFSIYSLHRRSRPIL